MKSGIILAIGGLAFLTGCGNLGGDAASKAPAPAKPKAPYHIEFATPGGQAQPGGRHHSGDKLHGRLQGAGEKSRSPGAIGRFGGASAQPAVNQMIMGPVDLPDETGSLPASYMDLADKGLVKLLADGCVKGPVKIKVVLVRSSIKPDAGDGEIDAKRLSDWLPTEVAYKNPHPKC